jgi:AbrB family looped-hinge helix DNA binding protein
MPVQFDAAVRETRATMATTFHSVTKKGQVTIPIEVRRALDIREGDQVGFMREGDHYILVRPEDVIRRTAGSLADFRLARPLTIEEEDEAYEQGVADQVLQSMGEEG